MARKTNGSAIRVMREALGIKQIALAARVGIGRSHMCEIELGSQQPAIATAQRIAEALGVPLDAITYPVPEAEALTA